MLTADLLLLGLGLSLLQMNTGQVLSKEMGQNARAQKHASQIGDARPRASWGKGARTNSMELETT